MPQRAYSSSFSSYSAHPGLGCCSSHFIASKIIPPSQCSHKAPFSSPILIHPSVHSRSWLWEEGGGVALDCVMQTVGCSWRSDLYHSYFQYVPPWPAKVHAAVLLLPLFPPSCASKLKRYSMHYFHVCHTADNCFVRLALSFDWIFLWT